MLISEKDYSLSFLFVRLYFQNVTNVRFCINGRKVKTTVKDNNIKMLCQPDKHICWLDVACSLWCVTLIYFHNGRKEAHIAKRGHWRPCSSLQPASHPLNQASGLSRAVLPDLYFLGLSAPNPKISSY